MHGGAGGGIGGGFSSTKDPWEVRIIFCPVSMRDKATILFYIHGR